MSKYVRNEIIFALAWIILAMIIILLVPMEVKGRSGSVLEGNSAEFFPYISASGLLLLSLMLIKKLFKNKSEIKEIKEEKLLKKEVSIFRGFERQIIIILATIVYLFLLDVWGYLISTILLVGILYFTFSSFKKINWLNFSIYTFFFPFVMYYLFEKLMMVPLP